MSTTQSDSMALNGAASGTASFRAGLQRFGRFVSGMIMPIIGAFIAWGLITTLFIPTGWIPNEKLSSLVGPMITYLLPLLIGFTAGKQVWGVRGGVIGAIATMGVIVGADIPMFIGAMLIGPFAAWVMKKSDKLVEGKVPVGFEMLVDNFSLGILGMLIALLGYVVIGPVISAIVAVIQGGVQFIVDIKALPLISLFIEPGKVLFLNNAINHGILSPLGIQQVQESGKSIMFLLETNPGPGLGILLAYWLFSKGNIKASAPGAIIIHFFGGIHEIYFPYILMKPILILAAMGGGMAGVLTNMLLGSGAVAAPSPGSIFALLAMSPKGGHLSILMGVIVATAVSFVIAMPFVKRSADQFEDEALDEAKDSVKSLKASGPITKVLFACDAGMGSSAMGANKLTKLLKAENMDIKVEHCSVDDIPRNAQLVICHRDLAERVKLSGTKAQCISVTNLVNAPEYKEVVQMVVDSHK
ncbi:PTS mannitol transporter subunit IICB [Spirochaeta isovalerica]|uniref:protein-N(pi)-phosphohistidine--D-mannitol phosphotransferase n=1 Tax=Spirochaeta isovalerica TaxID=150 RepID=A0A841R5B3_9SPIO|nr:PTS mannitol transporter subunit IICBA [Spirochaeta isovalerica]MBB6480354.1 PTS system mannitol-specific IIC component [Spirochaeta isovalerica]